MNTIRLLSTRRLAAGAASVLSPAPKALASTVRFQSVVPVTSSQNTLPAAAVQAELNSLGSVDHGYDDDRIDRAAEPEKRAFTYFMLGGARFLYASTARVLVTKAVSQMCISADALALAQAEFDVSKVPEGTTINVKWRGKPIFIRKRTADEIDDMAQVSIAQLRDPEIDTDRQPYPEWSVIIAICTHLGCVPIADAGEFAGGFFCPCHGSHYDVSGRIRKGPAPLNMEVPPFKFTDDTTILIG